MSNARSAETKIPCVASLAVLIALASGPCYASSINYAGNGGIIVAWGPWSFENAAFGEIFTAPDATLLDYSLTASDGGTGVDFPFVSEIYQWNGSQIVGPALYVSSQQVTAISFTTYTFTPDIALTAGDQYVALVTNEPDGTSLGGSGYSYMESSSAPLSGSGFVDVLPAATYTSPINAAFQADFAATATPLPEPAALPLFASGLGALGLLGWRRKRKSQAIA